MSKIKFIISDGNNVSIENFNIFKIAMLIITKRQMIDSVEIKKTTSKDVE